MGKTVLRNPDGIMVKSFDTVNTVIEFTTDVNEALNYDRGEWFANSELEYLQFHCKEHMDKLKDMKAEYVSTSTDEDKYCTYWQAADGMAPVVHADEDIALNQLMEEGEREPQEIGVGIAGGDFAVANVEYNNAVAAEAPA